MAPPNDEFRWVQPFDPRAGQAAVDQERSAYYAQRYAAQRAGRGPAIVVENLDSEFRKALVERRRMASAGINADEFPFSVTPRGNVVPRAGFSRVAQSMDRVFDIPYNPYRTRVAVETPVAKREIRARCRYYMKYEPLVASAIALHCFPPGEKTFTRDGFKNIEDVRLEDEVLGRNGNYQRPKALTRQDFTGDLVSVKGVGLLPIRATDNHPFLVKTPLRENRKYPNHTRDKDKCWSPSKVFVWKTAGELQPLDYLVFPKFKAVVSPAPVDLARYMKDSYQKHGSVQYWVRDNEIVNTRKTTTFNRYVSVNEDLGELLGWYVSEGYGTSHAAFCTGVSHEDSDRVVTLVKRVFGLDATVDARRPRNQKVVVCNRLVASFLQDVCGRGAYNKRIPQFIIEADSYVVSAFLRGYLKGDGCDRSPHDYKCVTVSEQLARQLQLVATKCDVYFSILKINNKTHNVGQFVLGAPKSMVLPRIFGVPQRLQRDRLPYVREDADNFYVPVRTVSREKFDGVVLNLTTPDNTFTIPVTVHNTEYPISSFHLSHNDKGIEQEINDMADELDLFEFILQMVHEFWGVGVAFPCGIPDDAVNPTRWTRFVLLDPDKVVMNAHPFVRGNRPYQIQLMLDDTIRAIVEKGPNDPNTGELFRRIPPDIRKFARMNQPVPMKPVQVSKFARTGSNPFDMEGESIVENVFHCLAYKDKLRDAQYTLMERHATPMELWKIGRADLQPDPETLNAFRDLLSATWLDPNRAFVWGPDVSMDVIGGAEKVIPLRDEYQALEMEILSGLMINKAMIYGEGPTYANASVGLEVLVSRYVTLRHRVEKWIRRAVFEPIFRIHNIYRQSPANLQHRIRTKYTKTPDLPTVRWDKANLRDNDAKVKILQELVQKDLVARKLLYQALGIDEETAERDLIEQDRKDAARARQKKILKMTKESPEEEPTGGPPGAPPGGLGGGGPMEGGEEIGGGGMITPLGLGTEVPAGVGPELPPEFPGPEAVETLGEEGL